MVRVGTEWPYRLFDEKGEQIGTTRTGVNGGFFIPGVRYTVSGPIPEPEPERVKPIIEARPLTVNMRCPKCQLSRYGIDPQSIPEECPSCGVRFEKVDHDA